MRVPPTTNVSNVRYYNLPRQLEQEATTAVLAKEVFVYRYRYAPTNEARDQTRLREIELSLKALGGVMRLGATDV